MVDFITGDVKILPVMQIAFSSSASVFGQFEKLSINLFASSG